MRYAINFRTVQVICRKMILLCPLIKVNPFIRRSLRMG